MAAVITTSNAPGVRCVDGSEFWNVPPRNPDFIGRCEILRELDEYFSEQLDHTRIAAIHGAVGTGKTSIALQYVWTRRSNYNGVYWFHAQNPHQLMADYAALALKLNLLGMQVGENKANNFEEIWSNIKLWFEKTENQGWLIVYDSCQNYNDIIDLLPVSGGSILITAKYSFWHEGKSFGLHKFSYSEAADYIERVLGEDNVPRADIKLLAETTDYLPLAIAQACAYIKCSQLTISQYLDL